VPRDLELAPGLELPPDAVTQTFGILAKKGAGKSNAAAVMAEEMHKAGLQFVVVDPVGAWWGLRSSADGKGPGLEIPVLGGYHGDVPLEPTQQAGELVADLVVDERVSCVIDVSSFESETKKRTFLASFAERLFRQKGRPGHEEPLHLFLEEADDYAPQRATGEVARCLGAFQRIVKRGRARGIGATMISQRSAALNKDLLTQIDTLIVLRTTGPRDRKAIEEWVTYHDTDDAIISSLSELRAGEAWVWSPEFLDLVKRVQIRRRATFDSGATPKAGATRRAPKGLADVDVTALEARMKETIERAKAEDPAELRRRIAVLERERRTATTGTPPVAPDVVVERVEVSVLTEQDRAFLASLRSDLSTVLAGLTGLADMDRRLGEFVRGVGERAERALSVLGRGGGRSPVNRQEQAVGRPSRATGGGSGPADDPVRPSLDGHVAKPQQRILDALAWLGSVRVDQVRKVQLAILAHQSPKSSGYTNNLGALRTAGLIEYPSGGVVALTDAGRAIASAPASPPRNEDLWRTLEARLAAPQWRILWSLIERYPASVGRDELAELAEQSPTSSGYTNNLGALRSLGFIGYPAGREVVALPVLFLE